MVGFLRFFTIERQFILFVFSIIMMFVLHSWAGFAGSWFPFLIVLFLIVKHFLIGTVNAAAMKLQFGDFDGAEKLLKYTIKPSWLKFTYHGMYYLIKGRIEFNKKNYKEVERLTEIALALDLQDDFRAMLYLQMINIHGMRKNQLKVKEYYQKAKKLNVTQEEVRQNIAEIGQMLKGNHKTQKQMMGKKAQRSMMGNSYMKRGRKKK
jgi:tetratricopeptide (TPR) repeat protein